MRSTLVRVFAAGCLGLLLAAALVAGEPGDSRPIHVSLVGAPAVDTGPSSPPRWSG
jgi:hypothetical protein